MAKPVVFATRKLPAAVEARLARDYEAILNPDDRLYGADELVEIAARADALLPCHTEKLTPEVIGRLPARVKAIANFSVGSDHVDVAAAKPRGFVVSTTPHVLSAATAEIAMHCMLGAASRGTEAGRGEREPGWRDWGKSCAHGGYR